MKNVDFIHPHRLYNPFLFEKRAGQEAEGMIETPQRLAMPRNQQDFPPEPPVEQAWNGPHYLEGKPLAHDSEPEDGNVRGYGNAGE